MAPENPHHNAELDPDIEKALQDASVLKPFRAMPYSHQREYTSWIISAKREETRVKRIEKSVAMIRKWAAKHPG